MMIILFGKYRLYFTAVACFGFLACSPDILDEKPTAFLNETNVFQTKAGFETALTGMYKFLRDEINQVDDPAINAIMHIGTDVATTGAPGLPYYINYLTTQTPQFRSAQVYWDWAYLNVIPICNLIVQNADRGNWANDAERNAIIAEAHFGRAYAYNALVNLFNGVPIVDAVALEPKFDFVRASRFEVLDFIRQDLAFAAQWLQDLPPADGRVAKAAANHLLSEVYISLGRETGEIAYYNQAVGAANQAIDDPNYQLMTERFGNELTKPGDAYSDLFRDGNQSRSSGNKEILWAHQIEYFSTRGGTGGSSGNTWLRAWGPFYINGRDPNNMIGFSLTMDSIGRGVGWVRPTNYFFYEIWKDSGGDIRNAPTNIRRDWYYNNPSSAYFGQKYEPHQFFGSVSLDTMRYLFPMIRKIEGKIVDLTSGRTYTDQPVMRLAETYLLRAEAYLLQGDLEMAASSINAVRARAKARLIDASEVTVDFILDERARELIIEEPRRRTLARMGTLVERTRKYGMRETTVQSIRDYHQWWPIPQAVIDANLGAELKQNPGY